MPSCSFSIGEDGKLKGKLKKESGNGWQAGINGSPEVSGYLNYTTSMGLTQLHI